MLGTYNKNIKHAQIILIITAYVVIGYINKIQIRYFLKNAKISTKLSKLITFANVYYFYR